MQQEESEKRYTVSEITADIRRAITSRFADVYVSGEISNYLHHSSGHMYFSLKDESSALRCVFFKGNNFKIPKALKLATGIKIVAKGRIDVYAAKGDYQLIVTSVEEEGEGTLAKKLEKLKKKLEEEGLFSPAHKVDLPPVPKCVGVVTSAMGAAVKDIIRVATLRYPAAHVIVYPVPVEGAKSAPEIAAAIDDMNRHSMCDVMIVGRGGGSVEDLWAFNEEVICRSVFQSKIPIVSAVGHERDVTLIDLVADVRAATPSNAAEIVFPETKVLKDRLNQKKRMLARGLMQKFNIARSHLDLIKKSRMWKEPTAIFEPRWQQIDDFKITLTTTFKDRIYDSKNRLLKLSSKIDALSPNAVLNRGYTMLTDSKGKVIRRAIDVKKGAKLKAALSEGKLDVTVDKVY